MAEATTFNDGSHDRLEQRLTQLDWAGFVRARQAAGGYYPSPENWQDEVLYFLMLDRFSDGGERGTDADDQGTIRNAFSDNDGHPVPAAAGRTTPLFRFQRDHYTADRPTWFDAGGRFCGGTLSGLRDKLGYIKRMGVTAIWVSPVFKQVSNDVGSYHGYGIQNFLDVDPHFGTRQDLRDLVQEAHRLGVRVILDIILNHTGDVFGYDPDRYWTTRDGQTFLEPRWDGNPYQVKGYRAADRQPTLPFGPVDLATHADAWPDGAVWPAELQSADTFTRRGKIVGWDYDPEYFEGDFESLKDVDHGFHDRDAQGRRIVDQFHPTAALMAMVAVYKFWIAFADVDGYRVDTVKHMEKGAVRLFNSAIHEFAQSLGKERFHLIGEITGGRQNAFQTLTLTGMDAALGIDEVAEKIEFMPKGDRNPEDYFNLFRNAEFLNRGTHTWIGGRVVTMFDDHDKVGRDKCRFCGDKRDGRDPYKHLVPAIALNLTTLGIPCIYYGTEQGFDGSSTRPAENGQDRLLRECMFGGPFGSLQSTGHHFFDEAHEIYGKIREITAVTRSRIELRRGRQYLRQISGTGNEGDFGYPRMLGGPMRSVVAWSRIMNDRELVLAINTDAAAARTAWVTVDSALHRAGDTLALVYATDPAAAPATLTVEGKNGVSVLMTLPASGFAIYE